MEVASFLYALVEWNRNLQNEQKCVRNLKKIVVDYSNQCKNP